MSRLFGLIMTTGILLLLAAPVTLTLVVVTLLRASSATKAPLRVQAPLKQLAAPSVLLLAMWAVASGFAQPSVTGAVSHWSWRSTLVIALLAFHAALSLVLWIRHRAWRGTGAALLLQFWVAIVASYISLWSVEGWPLP